MAELTHAGSMWWLLVRARIRSQLQYRGSFVLYTVGQFLVSFIDFLALAALFTRIDSLAGWSIGEIALLYGMAALSFNLCDLVVGSLDYLPTRIQDGSFDSYLLRPAGTLVQLSADGFALRRIGKVLQGLLVLVYALAELDLAWDAGRVALLVVSIVAGTVIFASIWVVVMTVCFWVIDGREVTNAFTYGGNFLANQPLAIYSTWLRRLVVFLIPIAFVNYFPALAILGRDDPFGTPEVAKYLGPAVAVVTALVAAAVWRNAVRHYRSTGS